MKETGWIKVSQNDVGMLHYKFQEEKKWYSKYSCGHTWLIIENFKNIILLSLNMFNMVNLSFCTYELLFDVENWRNVRN